MKMEDAFHNHYKKNQFNLLQAYTANSSNNLNKSPLSKKSTYSNDPKISSYHTKNNYSQKISNNKDYSQKKLNKDSCEQLYKSYINSIPFKKEKENYSFIKKENNNNKNYELNYYNTKRDNHSKKLDNKIKHYKKFNNIDTNIIFLPSNLKKNVIKNIIK